MEPSPRRVVPATEWEQARQELLVREKELTRAADALAAARRRMPVQRMSDHVLQGVDGPVRLVDVFEGRRQLVAYTFMWHDPERPCEGCSMFVDQFGHPAHLHARDVTRVVISSGPLAETLPYRERMGWTVPWYSTAGSDLYADLGHDGGFALDVFLRDGEDVYRTYTVDGRGVEKLGSVWSFLDLTPFGRQETWEDSPEGTPQSDPYVWWRRHDEYEPAGARP
ncbi:DUF899 family protein [Actinomycetospora cinnamomea]|uniref:Putative dithiol-disulfide oxidoreductase (DUF899 family) n=1 Tax=Actinomycetospora cinnamomea TaxID=663609 RepID=A0A2U1FD17_9PSEU|nr:DUF899 family protein [Actinomycetospora cinnamomea]PVZ10058.1 putative dithiol-disulfide oxidoreductase (DUF899 family) [Actinomycetospora cinnamomea]